MKFADIPDRSNLARIAREWFDNLRNAGITLENWFGSGYITLTTFTITNNQSSAANVTGLLLSSSTSRSAEIEVDILRVTTGGGATELKERRHYLAIWKPTSASWYLYDNGGAGDDSGVQLTITAAGQVQYTSTNISGTPSVSNMKFNVRTVNA